MVNDSLVSLAKSLHEQATFGIGRSRNRHKRRFASETFGLVQSNTTSHFSQCLQHYIFVKRFLDFDLSLIMPDPIKA